MIGSGSPSARLRPFRPMAFGRYTLLSPLATGGMGEIYLARLEGMSGFEKLCVIKKILSALASDQLFVERFVGEAKTLVKLSHGSIAQVLDVGLHEHEPYIALEFVDGKDLRKVAARQRDRSIPLPLTFVLYVMSRVLDALAYAHRKRDENDKEINLVHRDISPQNILVSYEGEVKVIDFGLAKSALSSAKTNPSMILGKFLYMSPEQAKHQKVDRRSDLYSVGVCLYEMISGRNPFDGVAPGDIMSRVANPVFPSLQEVDPLCPQAVVDVVMRALNADPTRRFQTAEEMRGKLLSALQEIDPSAGPESVSRYMREAFASEYQAERKLLALLNQAKTIRLSSDDEPEAKPADVDTAVVHLKDVAPSVAAAMNLSGPGEAQRPHKPSGPIEPTPLSFAPTPRAHEANEKERPEGETVPGISLDEATRPGAALPVAPPLKSSNWEAPDSIFDGVPKVTPVNTPRLEITKPGLAILPGDGNSRTNPGLPPTIEVSAAELLQPSDSATPASAREALATDTQPRMAVPAGVFEETVPRVVLGTLLEEPARKEKDPEKEETQPRARAFVGRRATMDGLEAQSNASDIITGPTVIPPGALGPPVLHAAKKSAPAGKKSSSGLKLAVLTVFIILLLVGAVIVLLPLLAGPDALPFKVPWARAVPTRTEPLNDFPPRKNNPVMIVQPLDEPKQAATPDASVVIAELDPKLSDDIDIEGLTEDAPTKTPVIDPPPTKTPTKTPVNKSTRKPPLSKKGKQLTSEFRSLAGQFEYVKNRMPCETEAMGLVCQKFARLKDEVEEAGSDAEVDKALKKVRELSIRVADQKRKLRN